jgi:hypothetical protein
MPAVDVVVLDITIRAIFLGRPLATATLRGMTVAPAERGAPAMPAIRALRRVSSGCYTAGTAVLAGLVYLVVSPTLIDDAYITLDYARNFGLHLHWGLVPGLVDNTATSPLHVLVLAVLIAVFRNGLIALGVSFMLSAVGLEWGLRRAARAVGLPAWTGLLATVLCLVNPLMLSSVGMEVMPCAALTAWLLVASVERRPWSLGLLAALLAVLRADFVIIAAVVFLFRREFWVGACKSVGTAVIVAASWYVPSWFLLGSAVPDTLVIKTLPGGRHWGGYTFGSGPALYWHVYPVAAVLACAPAAAGVLTWLAWAALRQPLPRMRGLDPMAALPVAAIAHYGAYSALGVPPYHWYYGPTIVLTTIFVAAAVTMTVAAKPRGLRLALRAAVMTAAVLLVCADIGTYAAPGIPRTYAPIATNWAATTTYRKIGLQLPGLIGNHPVGGPVEVGVIDYYCDCDVYQYFSDRGYFPAELARYERRLGAIGKAVMRLNVTYLDRSMRPHPTQLVLKVELHPDPHAIRNWRISTPWTGLLHQVQYVVLLLR